MRSVFAAAVAAALAAACGACSASTPGRAASPTVPSPVLSSGATLSAPSSGAPAAGPCGIAADPPAVYDHVIWIWMENHRYGDVLGNEHAPFEARFAAACATATDYHDVGSPSLPNYIAATSGDVQGIHDDAGPAAHPLTVDNLFRQVRASGRDARSYEEAMPKPCALEPSGRYAVKHNPAAYYTGGDDRAACARDDLPLGTVESGPFADALRDGTLPAFAFITPDLCNDTHDCPVSAGDAFVEQWVSLIVSSPVYRAGRTAVFVVWDEDTPMPNLFVAPSVRPGTRVTGPTDHYGLLRTTEELLGIPGFLGAAAQATSLRADLHL